MSVSAMSVMCVDASSSRLLLLGSAPQNGGYRVQWANTGGASHEREQTTKAQLRKGVPGLPMRDQPLHVRWSLLRRSRQGESRWSPSVREARPRGQAGRADLLLGRDALSH